MRHDWFSFVRIAEILKIMAPRYSHPGLVRFASNVFEAAGLAPNHAFEMASALVEADGRGSPSHGLLHLENWIRRIELGVVNRWPDVRVIRNAGAIALLDGDHGLGPVVARAAMTLAIEKSKEFGIGAVGVRNSSHYGIGARYSDQAAVAGCIGICACNTTPAMTMPGSSRRLIGTNPISISIPGVDAPRISLDMSLSKMTLGEVRRLHERHEVLPPCTAVDPQGEPTRSPAAVLSGGAILPAGEHKGFGLALAVEILAGVLTGSSVGSEIGSLFVDYDRPQGTGHFFIAIDAEAFCDATYFGQSLDGLIEWITMNPSGSKGHVRLPGERAFREMELSRRNGIEISDVTWESLARLAARNNVQLPEVAIQPALTDT